MKATSLLVCTARPTTLYAHWSTLAGGIVLIMPMVNIEGTHVYNPWLIDVAHCLDATNRAVWHGNISRLLGTMYHAISEKHHLATVLKEIASRKPGKRSGMQQISPFEFPSEVARYLTAWNSFGAQFSWAENKNYVIDQTPVWMCIQTSQDCWRLQAVRGVIDPAYASPSDWIAFDRPRSVLKRGEPDSEEDASGPQQRRSPKKKKSRLNETS